MQIKGFQIDNSYYDDNSKESMPDLRFKDNKGYLEVTHALSEYDMRFQNHYNDPLRCHLLFRGLTKEETAKYNNDHKVNKKYRGKSVFTDTECSVIEEDTIKESELPSIPDTIQKKHEQHKNKTNIDLFIWIDKIRFNSLIESLSKTDTECCSAVNCIFKKLNDSCFNNIYIGCLDVPEYQYEKLFVFSRDKMHLV